MKQYDVIIIGTGQATGTILGRLLELKRSVAVVESDRTGGSCVNWGCTPTKTLIASARVAHVVRRSGEFGIEVPNQTTDFSKVMQRVNAIRDAASSGFTKWLEDTVDYYRGFGRFVDSHTVEVDGTRIRGEQIVIHTGTRSRPLDIPGMDTIGWLDNKGLLDLKELPGHLLVLGGAYIGMEFGQAFRRLGSDVTILEASPDLIPREDEDISAIARTIMEDEGITCITSATVSEVSRKADGTIAVAFKQGRSSRSIEGTHLLVAVGRLPNSDALQLELAGVHTDSRGFIEVDDQCRTSVPHIFALGDVNGKGAFTHTSVHDGQVFLSMLDGGDKKVTDRIPTYSLFIDPPLARVGMTERQATEAKIPYLVSTKEMSTISRAKEKSETKGRIKILVDQRDDTILGAAVFGVGGDEIIGMLSLAMQAGLRYQSIQDTVIAHPTVAELIPWMFQDLHTEVHV
ncbi:MAG: mercuric reductase [Spirochaetae bacterium HGW-Spirochaetae-2]|jgi:pyruvate/2-oxoglutarate dehydrogenase complex dihydrolipoamide dehydrogenase (E3) component|nr:MAG: mercuric reductase [Spirochaetae bacterium HGW-Spirochaetae-2]